MAANAAIELETTLAWAQGGYSVRVALGSEGDRANLLLDTGSSSLAVMPGAYDPTRDRALSATAWAQEIRYGGGAWAGPVLRSRLAFGHGHHARRIDDALFALIESDAGAFRGADGIFGLAYRGLDPAYDLEPLLRGRGVDPPATWTWPFDAGHALDLAKFAEFLHDQPRTTLTPGFSALEEEGVVRDRFALAVGRAVVHVGAGGMAGHTLAGDPLNRGVLVLGGGAGQQHLYHGGFHDIRIVHDLYYGANLRAVRVGGDDPVPVPPADPRDVAGRSGNALLDTGSSFLVLETSTYDAVLAAFAGNDPRFPGLVAEAAAALRDGHGVDNDRIDPQAWPDLHFHLEAPGGGDTVLRVPASHYWPRNALAHGQTLCLLMPQLPHFPKQSILGLPLFAGRYAVFDRTAGGGLGVVRLAARRGTA